MPELTPALVAAVGGIALLAAFTQGVTGFGSVLLKAGRAGEAAAAFEEVLRIWPGNARARALLELARAAGAGGEVPP